ncbi:MAG: insulinase family protein [Chloroflexota bacterium]|nr:insulinase family protein [Chloroflexota bacterium]
MFERTTLPEGPRVISARLPGTRSLSIAAYVMVGSRLESREASGTAHFMEHLTFKGTEAYPSTRAVSEAIEGIGGTSNAATDRESTVYWTRLPVRDAERGFHVLGELMRRPLLRSEDIAKEREIIVEEIRSYRDDPGQYVFNVFDETFFGDTPLGWEIAGDETSVRSLGDDDIRAFWSAGYRPANIVVAVAGDLSHDQVVGLVADSFGSGNGAVPGFAAAPSLPHQRFAVLERSTSQAHLCLGLPALRRDDPDQWTMELLNTVLGEGSSSRLFLRVREDAGLAYDVHSFTTDYADCGTLQVYAGVDPTDLAAALKAILEELARLRDEPVPVEELAKARAYARGRLELRLEESRHLASWLGVQEALHDQVLTLDDALTALDAVTPVAMHALAQRLIRDDALSLAVIAPGRNARRLEKALHLP